MAADPILFIAGLGRCGTTMMMRMLDHGGIPVAGKRPAYEPAEMMMSVPLYQRQLYVTDQVGKAVKWIGPLNAFLAWGSWTGGTVTSILMSRDPEHQAKSMAKFVGERPSKAGVAAIAASVRADQKKTEAYLEQVGNVYSMTFESVLREPAQTAEKLAKICDVALGMTLDQEAAAAAVIRRKQWCAPDMAIEEMLNQEEAANG